MDQIRKEYLKKDFFVKNLNNIKKYKVHSGQIRLLSNSVGLLQPIQDSSIAITESYIFTELVKIENENEISNDYLDGFLCNELNDYNDLSSDEENVINVEKNNVINMKKKKVHEIDLTQKDIVIDNSKDKKNIDINNEILNDSHINSLNNNSSLTSDQELPDISQTNESIQLNGQNFINDDELKYYLNNKFDIKTYVLKMETKFTENKEEYLIEKKRSPAILNGYLEVLGNVFSDNNKEKNRYLMHFYGLNPFTNENENIVFPTLNLSKICSITKKIETLSNSLNKYIGSYAQLNCKLTSNNYKNTFSWNAMFEFDKFIINTLFKNKKSFIEKNAIGLININNKDTFYCALNGVFNIKKPYIIVSDISVGLYSDVFERKNEFNSLTDKKNEQNFPFFDIKNDFKYNQIDSGVYKCNLNNQIWNEAGKNIQQSYKGTTDQLLNNLAEIALMFYGHPIIKQVTAKVTGTMPFVIIDGPPDCGKSTSVMLSLKYAFSILNMEGNFALVQNATEQSIQDRNKSTPGIAKCIDDSQSISNIKNMSQLILNVTSFSTTITSGKGTRMGTNSPLFGISNQVNWVLNPEIRERNILLTHSNDWRTLLTKEEIAERENGITWLRKYGDVLCVGLWSIFSNIDENKITNKIKNNKNIINIMLKIGKETENDLFLRNRKIRHICLLYYIIKRIYKKLFNRSFKEMHEQFEVWLKDQSIKELEIVSKQLNDKIIERSISKNKTNMINIEPKKLVSFSVEICKIIFYFEHFKEQYQFIKEDDEKMIMNLREKIIKDGEIGVLPIFIDLTEKNENKYFKIWFTNNKYYYNNLNKIKNILNNILTKTFNENISLEYNKFISYLTCLKNTSYGVTRGDKYKRYDIKKAKNKKHFYFTVIYIDENNASSDFIKLNAMYIKNKAFIKHKIFKIDKKIQSNNKRRKLE